MSVAEVLEAVKVMSEEDRDKVRNLLNGLPPKKPLPIEEVEARLRARGLLWSREPGPKPPHVRRTPVRIEGKPLSETIIEERR
jgi:hypothetical protein